MKFLRMDPETHRLTSQVNYPFSAEADTLIRKYKRQLARRFHKSSIKTTEYYRQGGPFDGQVLRVESTGTLPFTANNMHGFYDLGMRWVSLEK